MQVDTDMLNKQSNTKSTSIFGAMIFSDRTSLHKVAKKTLQSSYNLEEITVAENCIKTMETPLCMQIWTRM